MKLDFIPLLVSLTVLSFIATVNAQGKARKAPIEGSGSGLGPGVDDEDRGGQLPSGGSVLPKKQKTMKPPPISPSDRNRWPSPQQPTSAAGNSDAPPTPDAGSWTGAKTHPPLRSGNGPRPPPQSLPSGRSSRPQLPQQGDEGSGMPAGGGPQAPPDQESVPRKQLPMEILPTVPRKQNQFAAPPVSCREAQKARSGLNYYLRCDRDGYYERRQCKEDDCMCVDRNTGIVLEKTIALRAKNISCDEVVYMVQVPLKYHLSRHDDPDLLQRKIIGQLEMLLDNLPGEQRLQFQRYLPIQSYPISGLELRCTSIGHSDPSALARFLRDQAAKGSSLPLVAHNRPLNITRLGSARDSPAVENSGGSVGKNAHEQYNAGKDTQLAENDQNAPRNDESQSDMRKKKSGAAAFLQQPGIIAAIIGGGIAGFFLAILLILFCIYRIRKKDEGSYALEEPKKMPVSAAVYHSAPTREYYA